MQKLTYKAQKLSYNSVIRHTYHVFGNSEGKVLTYGHVFGDP